MYLHKNINSRGYATLLLVTIIGFSFLVAVSVVSREMRRAQDQSFAVAERLEARALANACQEEILVRLLRSPDYEGDETLDITGHECQVGKVTVDTTTNKFSFRLSVKVGNYIYSDEVKAKPTS